MQLLYVVFIKAFSQMVDLLGKAFGHVNVQCKLQSMR